MNKHEIFEKRIKKECEELDTVATLYKNWVDAIALNTSYMNVYEHLVKHMNEEPQIPRNLKDVNRWKLSLLNLFAIIEKQLQGQSDIKEQCKIIYEKALEYQDNSNNNGDYFENDYIESYKKLMSEVTRVPDACTMLEI